MGAAGGKACTCACEPQIGRAVTSEPDPAATSLTENYHETHLEKKNELPPGLQSLPEQLLVCESDACTMASVENGRDPAVGEEPDPHEQDPFEDYEKEDYEKENHDMPVLPCANEQHCVELVFDADGTETTVWAKHKPLGLIFHRSLPITVIDFCGESHGQSIGIQEGWILKSVNDETMIGSRTYEEATDMLRRHIDSLPIDMTSSNATIVFDVNGLEEKVQATHQPLGLNMQKSLPLTVVSCGKQSYGGRLGIKPGWIFKSVNGVDMLNVHSHDDALAILERHVGCLPRFSIANSQHH